MILAFVYAFGKRLAAHITLVILAFVYAFGKRLAAQVTLVILVGICAFGKCLAAQITLVILIGICAFGKRLAAQVALVILIGICAFGEFLAAQVALVILIGICAFGEFLAAQVALVILVGVCTFGERLAAHVTLMILIGICAFGERLAAQIALVILVDICAFGELLAAEITFVILIGILAYGANFMTIITSVILVGVSMEAYDTERVINLFSDIGMTFRAYVCNGMIKDIIQKEIHCRSFSPNRFRFGNINENHVFHRIRINQRMYGRGCANHFAEIDRRTFDRNAVRSNHIVESIEIRLNGERLRLGIGNITGKSIEDLTSLSKRHTDLFECAFDRCIKLSKIEFDFFFKCLDQAEDFFFCRSFFYDCIVSIAFNKDILNHLDQFFCMIQIFRTNKRFQIDIVKCNLLHRFDQIKIGNLAADALDLVISLRDTHFKRLENGIDRLCADCVFKNAEYAVDRTVCGILQIGRQKVTESDDYITNLKVRKDIFKGIVVAEKNDLCVGIERTDRINESSIFHVEFHIAVEIGFQRKHDRVSNGNLVFEGLIFAQHTQDGLGTPKLHNRNEIGTHLIQVFEEKSRYVLLKGISLRKSHLDQRRSDSLERLFYVMRIFFSDDFCPIHILKRRIRKDLVSEKVIKCTVYGIACLTEELFNEGFLQGGCHIVKDLSESRINIRVYAVLEMSAYVIFHVTKNLICRKAADQRFVVADRDQIRADDNGRIERIPSHRTKLICTEAQFFCKQLCIEML